MRLVTSIAIEAALERGDTAALVVPAHSLRSRSLSVGAVTLAHLAHSIELAGRAGNLDEARRAATEARTAMAPLEGALDDARSAEWAAADGSGPGSGGVSRRREPPPAALGGPTGASAQRPAGQVPITWRRIANSPR
jgi:hypothetical protein